MTNTDTQEERYRREPTVDDDGTIHLYGVGPECPGCGDPTHAVTAERAQRPWWCQDCNVRLDDEGDYGAAADFPADSQPSEKA